MIRPFTTSRCATPGAACARPTGGSPGFREIRSARATSSVCTLSPLPRGKGALSAPHHYASSTNEHSRGGAFSCKLRNTGTGYIRLVSIRTSLFAFASRRAIVFLFERTALILNPRAGAWTSAALTGDAANDAACEGSRALDGGDSRLHPQDHCRRRAGQGHDGGPARERSGRARRRRCAASDGATAGDPAAAHRSRGRRSVRAAEDGQGD